MICTYNHIHRIFKFRRKAFMWKYWDWDEILENYVKKYSKIIVLLISIFLLYTMSHSGFFENLTVHKIGYYNRRPELISFYSEYAAPYAITYLKKAMLICLIPVSILILISWKPYSDNKKSGFWMYNLALIIFTILILGYYIAVFFGMKSITMDFILMGVITIFLITTLVLNIKYYRKNKDSFEYGIYLKNRTSILIPFIIILGAELLFIMICVVRMNTSYNKLYDYYCDYTFDRINYDIFDIAYTFEGDDYDLAYNLKNNNATYLEVQYINYYNVDNYKFTIDELIEGLENMENSDYHSNTKSWSPLYKFLKTYHLSYSSYKYLLKYSLYGYRESNSKYMNAFVDNVIRRLEQLGYDDYLSIDRAILDEACEYVYNTIESGLYEPLDEVTLDVTYKNNSVTVTGDCDEKYFIKTCTIDKNNDLYIELYHTVGYYFDENTKVNINGIEYSDIDYDYVYDINNVNSNCDLYLTISPIE